MANFRSTRPLAALTAFQQKEQTKAGLLKEAALMTPDNEAITKVLSDFNLYSADKVPYQEAVYSRVSDFMGKYRSNPFYAFSKEGRGTVASLQQIASNPGLKAMEQQTTNAESEFKRAQPFANNYAVSGNGSRISVYRDGKRIDVPLDNLKEGDIPLTINDEHMLISSPTGIGLAGYGKTVQYNMEDPVKVEDKIRAAFSGLGTTTVGKEVAADKTGDVILRQKTQQNRQQVNERVSTLLYGSGLTDSERNTLVSEYVRQHPEDRGPGMRQRAMGWIKDSIEGMANGERTSLFTSQAEVSAAAKANAMGRQTAAMESQSSAQLGWFREAAAGLSSPQTAVPMRRGSTDKFVEEHGYPISSSLAAGIGQVKDVRSTKQGETIPSGKLTDIRLFDAVPKNLPFYITSQKAKDGTPAGELLPVDSPGMYNNMVLDGRQDMTLVRMPVGPEGQPIPIDAVDAIRSAMAAGRKIPDQYAQYLPRGPHGILLTPKQGTFIKAAVLAASNNDLFGDGAPAKQMEEIAKEGSYKHGDSLDKDYYNKHNFNTAGHADSYWFFPDKVYKFDTYFPLSSEQMAAEVTGADVRGNKGDTDVTSGFNLEGTPLPAANYPDALQQNKAFYNGLYRMDSTD